MCTIIDPQMKQYLHAIWQADTEIAFDLPITTYEAKYFRAIFVRIIRRRVDGISVQATRSNQAPQPSATGSALCDDILHMMFTVGQLAENNGDGYAVPTT